MNKQLMHIIRFFLGGYIIFIGIRLLIQVTDQDPSNRILLSAIATILSLAGAVSVIYSGRKLWFLLKPEGSSVKDTEEDSEDSAARKRAAAKRKGMNPMVDISDPLRSKEKEGSAGEKEDTLQQEQTGQHEQSERQKKNGHHGQNERQDRTGQHEQPAEHRADGDNEADAGTDDQQNGAEYVRQTADRKHSMRLDSVEREEELEREEKQESKAKQEGKAKSESKAEQDTEEDSGLEDDDETDAEIIEELETDYEEM